MSRRNNFTSTTTHLVRALPKLVLSVLPSQTCFVLACRGFWNTLVIHGSGTWQKSRLLRYSVARPGPWRICVLWVHCTENDHCFWLETWTTEIFTALLANVLERVDVAVFKDQNMFIQRLPHQALSFLLHVTTPTLTVCLSRLP